MKQTTIKYKTIMEYLISEMQKGKLLSGDKVYSETQLMEKFEVSRYTVRHSLKLLAIEGYIETQQGKGSFIANNYNNINISIKGKIALLLNYSTSYTAVDIIESITSLARNNNINILINFTDNKIIQERAVLSNLLKEDLLGIILEPSKSAMPAFNQDLYDLFEKKRVPIIFIQNTHNILKNDYIMLDNYDTGLKLTNYLISRNRRKIGLIMRLDEQEGIERYNGIVSTLINNNLEVNEELHVWITAESLRKLKRIKEYRKQILSPLAECDSLICFNDDIAIQAQQEFGNTKIIVSCDSTLRGINDGVKLTGVKHDYKNMGRLAYEKLLLKIAKPNQNIKENLKGIFVDNFRRENKY